VVGSHDPVSDLEAVDAVPTLIHDSQELVSEDGPRRDAAGRELVEVRAAEPAAPQLEEEVAGPGLRARPRLELRATAARAGNDVHGGKSEAVSFQLSALSSQLRRKRERIIVGAQGRLFFS
jgi:hypothetical protein